MAAILPRFIPQPWPDIVIVYRYLAREVLTSMAAVSAVLLLIIMSGRFVNYLAEAASGKLDAAVLLTLMGYRIPSFLELILPLGLFIGILLAYGRLYVESEMTVLSACGMSERRLVGYTLMTATVVSALVALFSLYLGPMGVRASENLLAEQRSKTEFEMLKPSRFHKLSNGDGVSYVNNVNTEERRLENVFLAGAGNTREKFSVITAQYGETSVNQQTGQRFLILYDGHQYRGRPGDLDFEVIDFTSYTQFIPQGEVVMKKETDATPTLTLMQQDTSQAWAALQWRMSLPMLVLIIALLAVPLSRTEPRKGRYVKMIPAILLYIVYLVTSNAARGLLEEGKAPVSYLLWLVHGAFLLLAILMLSWPTFKRSLTLFGARRPS